MAKKNSCANRLLDSKEGVLKGNDLFGGCLAICLELGLHRVHLLADLVSLLLNLLFYLVELPEQESNNMIITNMIITNVIVTNMIVTNIIVTNIIVTNMIVTNMIVNNMIILIMTILLLSPSIISSIFVKLAEQDFSSCVKIKHRAG